MRSGIAASLVVLSIGSVGGCSCGDPELVNTSTTTGTVGGGGSSTGGDPTGGVGGIGGTIIPQCESEIICGQGECCDEGDECVLAACLAACDSQVRCGDDLSVCCAGGEVCLNDTCVVPGANCLDWADCEADEFCEPTLGQCLPQPVGEDLCEFKPDPGPLTPTLEWSWTGSTIFPNHHQVINMPVVVDLEQDGVPDVVIVTSDSYDANGVAYLRALDGATGLEKWADTADVYQAAYRIQPRGTPAAADIDDDGFVEIVTPKAGGGLIAFEHDGTFKWSSTQANGVTPWTTAMASATVAIADLEGDGTAEIVVAGVIFNADGSLRADNGVFAGSNNGNYGAVSIIADLDGDDVQEIVTGRRAYRADGTMYLDNGLTDGYPAIADLDLDGNPEVVVIANNTIRIQDPLTMAVIASMTMPAAGAGGPPTIANFDADPAPEIASANGGAYAVFKYTALPTPAVSLLWSQVTQDLSSNRTGSSVFDFQGDGVAEVVYADECYFRIYNGPDGSNLFEVEASSATIHEYPVVADVDGDNNTEIVLTANDLNHLSGSPACPYGLANLKHGVFVYGDANDNWVRTRKIWNQHAYHITNIRADGTLPILESPSWLPPNGLNNYRQSNQGAGVFNAPDLQVSLQGSLSPCPTGIGLRATVQNVGSLGVPAGIPVSFYQGTSANGTYLGTVDTQGPLLPGQFEIVEWVVSPAPPASATFFVVVDANMAGEGTQNECLEDNNDASVQGVKCPEVN